MQIERLIKLSMLCFITKSIAIDVHENVTEVTELIVVNGNLTVKNNTNEENKLDMQRIIQPSTNVYYGTRDEKSNFENNRNDTKRQTFIPSPQLDTYFEYNKFPVPPAIPESKHIRSNLYLPPPIQTGLPEEQRSNSYSPTKYYDRLNFGPPVYITSTERPTTTPGSKQIYSDTDRQLGPKGDLNQIKFLEEDPRGHYNSLFPPIPFEWPNKWPEHTKIPEPLLAEHPYPFMTSNFSEPIEEHALSVQKMTHEEGHASKPRTPPWKRAVKLLATFIPIGLLLSAFTPNILTIGPVNTTHAYCRKLGRRSEDKRLDVDVNRWSRPGCEARLLCELSLLDDEASAEESRKLFWKLMNQNDQDVQIAGQLEAVSKAIKRRTCEQITCRPAHVNRKREHQ